MTIKLYDLAGEDAALRFSPFCWRTKMALKHKGLPFETEAWHITGKEA
ncbi:MAG TPA: glutathione S-transferase, partial [Rhodospirillaceae bacterium]|nr:glutathione S-transferase [Rhodospirillaceae bacterium]